MHDRWIRRFIPSAARLSYNPVFRVIGNTVSNVISFPFPELRRLPPNNLRVRVGVGNRLVNNQVYHLQVAYEAWLFWLSQGFARADSDVLEIGCGCGRIALPLMGEWFTGTYVGVDIDPDAIAFCEARFPAPRFTFALSPHTSKTYVATGTSGAAKVAASALTTESSRDFVVATSLYSHLLEAEAREYLQASYDCLRPGGAMLLTFFAMDHVTRGGRWTFAHRDGNAYVENETYPEAAVAYTEEFMREMVTAVGFQRILMVPSGAQSVLVAWK